MHGRNNRRTRLDKHTTYTLTNGYLRVMYKGAMMQAHGHYWKALYVWSPPGWSSGRSWRGLCGNNDGSAGNDRAMWGHFNLNGKRTYFKVNRPMTEIEVEDADLQDSLDAGLYNADFKKADNAEDDENKLIAKSNKEQVKLFKRQCGKIAHGQDKKDCLFDKLAGTALNGHHKFNPEETAALAEVRDHEKLLYVCKKDWAKARKFAGLKHSHRDKDGKIDGVSFALWFAPKHVNGDSKGNILTKGNVELAQDGEEFVARYGQKTIRCSPSKDENKMKEKEPTQYVVTISGEGKVNIAANCQPCGSEDTGVKFEDSETDLVLGGVGFASGKVSYVFYDNMHLDAGVQTNRYCERRKPPCKTEDRMPGDKK
jgi:hypothetical protein